METLIFLLGVCRSSDELCVAVDDLLAALRQTFSSDAVVSSLEDFSKVEEYISSSKLIILLFNEAPERMPSGDLISLYKQAMDKCVELRARMVHVVKNFKGTDTEVAWQMSGRAKKMFRFHDLEVTTLDQVADDIRNSNDTESFSSPGESFAWQLVAGFLSYILPDFQTRIKSSLLDDQDSVRQEILQEFGVTDVDPKQILVLPKFLLLLSESIVCSQQSVAMYPQELFPGCKKISNASSDLCLEFDSPGYKKRIASYLMKLDKPLMKDQSTYSHVMLFSGYAAPIFIMQKLDMSNDEKQVMYQQFRDELLFILNHPNSSEMLRDFSDSSSEELTGLESRAIQLIDVSDEVSVRSCIIDEAESHLTTQSWCLVPKSLPPSAEKSLMEDPPLMSMAFAMAANTWIGFSQLLLSHTQEMTAAGHQIPFDLPYCFVIPRSGRYPDEAKLHKRFEEIGVVSEQLEFRVTSGRRYTYRVHNWSSHRLAFEIPASVLGIRKQAGCGVGGIRTGHLSAHLTEFRDALARFVAGSDGRFKVIEWDDVTEFHDQAWMEPSGEFARSLLSCLGSSIS